MEHSPDAVDFDRLEIYGQRITDQNGSTVKVELLTRLPKDFDYPSIESFFGALTPQQTLEITKAQIQAGAEFYAKTGIEVSINVDNSVLVESELTEHLITFCERQTHPFTLEFTELKPMPPSSDINAIFFRLKQNGIKIALDDFGTGFNGMSTFADYDFDIIKLDRSLILGIQTRPQKLLILKHVLDLADALGKEHVVEGVETQDQLDTLNETGFRHYQGFLFNRPVPLKELL